jgi:hypothetical protein
MRRAGTLSTSLLCCLLVAGCGGKEDPVNFSFHEVGVRVETNAAFAHRDGFQGRLEEVVSASLSYWGGDWSRLAGRTITFSSGPYVTCGATTSASGCFDGELRIATWDPGVGTVSCVEQTVLVHEIGHAIIGDRMHQDPRWMEFDAVAAELAGGTGYGPNGETPCVVSVSVWRHPLDAP